MKRKSGEFDGQIEIERLILQQKFLTSGEKSKPKLPPKPKILGPKPVPAPRTAKDEETASEEDLNAKLLADVQAEYSSLVAEFDALQLQIEKFQTDSEEVKCANLCLNFGNFVELGRQPKYSLKTCIRI